MMVISFQPADEKDIGRIYTLSKDLIDRYEDIETIDYDKVLVWVHRKIVNHIDSYTRILSDGQHAGYYRLCPAGDMMELDDLYIFPEFQRQGIGTQVIRKCCSETNLPIMLYVFSKNTRALALYERLGFNITEAVGSSRYIMVRTPEEAL